MVSVVRALTRSLGPGDEEEVLIYYESDAIVKFTSSILPPWKSLESSQVGEVYTSRHQLSTLLLASADFQNTHTGISVTASLCSLGLGIFKHTFLHFFGT